MSARRRDERGRREGERERVVVVGNGMAGARFVDELTTAAPGRFAITVVGDEAGLAYNRVLLSSYLAREVDGETLMLKAADWWTDRGVAVVSGQRVCAIDAHARSVTLADGRGLGFERLVLATGSDAVRLPLPGAALPGVLAFRTRADADAMLAAARPGLRAVVIGGGLLGLEAAHGLAKAGAEVTVVHLMDRLMERQLDGRAAGLLRCALERKGIRVLLGAESAAIEGDDRVTALRLKDGRVVAADLVVMAVGIRPNAALARAAGLAVNRGVVVGDHLEASAPGIHAIGECAEHKGCVYGLVEPAYEQARVLAAHLAGRDAAYSGSLLSTNLKVSGVGVFSAGDFMGGDGAEEIVLADPGRGAYRKLVVREGRLAGAVLVGDTADALWYLDLIRGGRRLGALRNELVFGRAYAPPEAAAA